eukprot:4979940-Alexandrium_andersonii.AAC.1
MADQRESSRPVRKTLFKRGEPLSQITRGSGQDPEGSDDDRMETSSPRAGHRRPALGRSRGASTPSSLRSNLLRIR